MSKGFPELSLGRASCVPSGEAAQMELAALRSKLLVNADWR
jgi:hypothetical protein